MATKDPVPTPKEDNIHNEDIVTEMRRAYLDYAMSVITARALPDARDGLKPVARRILYAMFGMGLRSNAKTRKSAAVVGEVLGKYHPHGNTAVYESMAKVVQDFTTRYPLVIGQGNFGSVDGDSPAAERYTEAKLSPYAEEMLRDIEKNTVEFKPNYENTLQEPEVLPATPPNLLLNGTLGIAVGMASDIPPHNLNEIVDAAKHLIENKDATTADLLQFIQGPDFPLGAIAYDKKAIANAYATGKGKVVVRGESEIVDGKKGSQIIITSIPYRVNKAEMLKKIGALVQEKKIEGIKDIRDESTKDIRVVLDLKSTAQPLRVQNMLYKHTQLEDPFHYNMVALVDGVPRQVNIHELLTVYINHRREVVEKRTRFDLENAKNREHILLGLKKAQDNIDAVIKTIKDSKDTADARAQLMKKFKLSEIQANAILGITLGKLAKLERKKIEEELKDIQKLISSLEAILKSAKKIDAEVVKGLDEVQKKFGDERRTKIVKGTVGNIELEDLIPQKECVVMITEGGYIKRSCVDEYRAQKRGGVGTKGAELKQEDFTTISNSASTHDSLLFFTNKGKIYQLKTYDIPEGKRTAKGRALVNFLSLTGDEKVTSIVPVTAEIEKTGYIFFVTRHGTIKKVELKQFSNIRKTGIIAVSLEKDDQLVSTFVINKGDTVFMATKKGKSIHFASNEVKSVGRSARGVRGIKLGDDDEVVSAMGISKEAKDPNILSISSKGYGKQTALKSFKVQKRGGGGIKVASITDKTGDLVNTHLVIEKGRDIVTMSKNGQVVRTNADQIPMRERQTQGVSVMKLKGGDVLTSTTYL